MYKYVFPSPVARAVRKQESSELSKAKQTLNVTHHERVEREAHFTASGNMKERKERKEKHIIIQSMQALSRTIQCVYCDQTCNNNYGVCDFLGFILYFYNRGKKFSISFIKPTSSYLMFIFYGFNFDCMM